MERHGRPNGEPLRVMLGNWGTLARKCGLADPSAGILSPTLVEPMIRASVNARSTCRSGSSRTIRWAYWPLIFVSSFFQTKTTAVCRSGTAADQR